MKWKRNDDEHFTIEKVFIDDEDKNLNKSEITICLIWNGLNYFAPAMECIICELSDDLTRSNQMDVLERSVQLLAKLPPSGSKESLSKTILHMRAAKEFLCDTQVTTGTTNVTLGLATALPVPLSMHPKVTWPRLFTPHSAKRIRKCGNDDNPEKSRWGWGHRCLIHRLCGGTVLLWGTVWNIGFFRQPCENRTCSNQKLVMQRYKERFKWQRHSVQGVFR